jgi:hypothetical protein
MKTFERVIFALDDDYNDAEYLHFLAKSTVDCLGSWEGITENSYITTREEFEALPSYFTKNQVCVLVIPPVGEMSRQPSYLLYPDGTEEIVGTMKEVDEATAKSSIGYTLVKKTQRYFIVE